jgi:F-type H+-transporting ATPase subunit c
MPARYRSLDSTEYKIKRIPEVRRNNTPAGFSKDRRVGLQNNKIGDNKMSKIKFVFFAALALALMAIPAFAQAGAADNQFTVDSSKAIGAGIGFGLAAGLAGIGQGLVGSRAAEGAARNTGAAGTVQTLMIIALALIESLVLFALLIAFVKL